MGQIDIGIPKEFLKKTRWTRDAGRGAASSPKARALCFVWPAGRRDKGVCAQAYHRYPLRDSAVPAMMQYKDTNDGVVGGQRELHKTAYDRGMLDLRLQLIKMRTE